MGADATQLSPCPGLGVGLAGAECPAAEAQAGGWGAWSAVNLLCWGKLVSRFVLGRVKLARTQYCLCVLHLRLGALELSRAYSGGVTCASDLHTQLPLGACGRGGHRGWHERIECFRSPGGDPSFQRWQRRGQELGPEGGEGGDKLHRGAKAHLGGAQHGQGPEAGPGRPFARREPGSAWTCAESEPAGRLVSAVDDSESQILGGSSEVRSGAAVPGGAPPWASSSSAWASPRTAGRCPLSPRGPEAGPEPCAGARPTSPRRSLSGQLPAVLLAAHPGASGPPPLPG